MSPVADGEEGRSWKHGEWGIHCSLSLSSTVSLYLWHLQHDQGHCMTPGRTRSPQCASGGDLAECCGSLTDFKTIALMPITLRESAGLKFAWMRAITGLHARFDHEGWIMVRFGSAGVSGRFNALSVTMSVSSVIWHRPSGEVSHVLHCCPMLLMENSNPEAGQLEGQRRDCSDIFFSSSVSSCLWDVFS